VFLSTGSSLVSMGVWLARPPVAHPISRGRWSFSVRSFSFDYCLQFLAHNSQEDTLVPCSIDRTMRLRCRVLPYLRLAVFSNMPKIITNLTNVFCFSFWIMLFILSLSQLSAEWLDLSHHWQIKKDLFWLLLLFVRQPLTLWPDFKHNWQTTHIISLPNVNGLLCLKVAESTFISPLISPRFLQIWHTRISLFQD